MPTEAPTKPKRETWRDWLPPNMPPQAEDDLVTRDQLLDQVKRRCAADTKPVTEIDLRYWEHLGALPGPVRKWHNGATRALYPGWMWLAVREVRLLQRAGYSLAQIAPQLRAYVDRNWGSGASASSGLPRDTCEALLRLADAHAQASGVAVKHVDVRVVNVDGTDERYVIPVETDPPALPSASVNLR